MRLVVGMHAIPWPAPHTRPINVTVHANDPTLIVGTQPWVGSLEVPGSLAALLEVRLGEQDRPAMGFAAHVPHYLVQAEFPRGALALLQALSAATGMAVPLDELRDAAEESDADISIQIASNPENMEAVTTLEEQYDAMMAGRANAPAGSDALPTRHRHRGAGGGLPRPARPGRSAVSPQDPQPEGSDSPIPEAQPDAAATSGAVVGGSPRRSGVRGPARVVG